MKLNFFNKNLASPDIFPEFVANNLKINIMGQIVTQFSDGMDTSDLK